MEGKFCMYMFIISMFNFIVSLFTSFAYMVTNKGGEGGTPCQFTFKHDSQANKHVCCEKKRGRIRPCYVPVKPYEKKIIFQGSWGTLLQNHADKV